MPTTFKGKLYPDEETCVDRPVEGFYLLNPTIELPRLKNAFESIPPLPFDENGA